MRRNPAGLVGFNEWAKDVIAGRTKVFLACRYLLSWATCGRLGSETKY